MLDDAFQATAQLINLAPTLVFHISTEMLKETHFVTRDYGALTASINIFIFIYKTDAAVESSTTRSVIGKSPSWEISAPLL